MQLIRIYACGLGSQFFIYLRYALIYLGLIQIQPTDLGAVVYTVCPTYSSSLSGPPTISIALSILDMEYLLDQNRITFDAVYQNKSMTGFCFTLELMRRQDLVSVLMTYLTVDPAFTEPFSIAFFRVVRIHLCRIIHKIH